MISNNLTKVVGTFADEFDLDVTDFVLLRVGQNAMFMVPKLNIVLRIYRDRSTGEALAAREFRIASILEKGGVATIRPAAQAFDAIVNAGGFVATAWELIDRDLIGPSSGQFGKLMRNVHSVFERAKGDIANFPKIDPIQKMKNRVEDFGASAELTSETIGKMRRHLSFFETTWSNFSSLQSLQILHGDAHTGNVIMQGGVPTMCDFDACGVGPVEWDLVPIQIISRRFKPDEETMLLEFDCAYGVSDELRENAEKLLKVREFSMITWLAQDAKSGTAREAQVIARLNSLDEVSAPFSTWEPK